MTDDSNEARKKRADDLRETIRQIKKPAVRAEPPLSGDPAPGKHEESPLEFINRRMRELDAAQKNVEGESGKAGDHEPSS